VLVAIIKKKLRLNVSLQWLIPLTQVDRDLVV